MTCSLLPGLALREAQTVARAASDNPTYLAGRERIYEGIRIAGLPEG
jgi:hypothetical protein